MEKVQDLLVADSDALRRRFGKPGFQDYVLQLGGNDPFEVEACLQRLAVFGYEFPEVNLNCGCPSIESGGATTFGASLMKQPQLTKELLASIKCSVGQNTKVSMKSRIGVYETAEEMESFNQNLNYQVLQNYISHAAQAGIDHVVLHARPVVLSGLSPTKNRQIPMLQYELVRQVAHDFRNLKVTLNGGIASLHQLSNLAEEAKSSNDVTICSFMAGRWMLRRPLDLAFASQALLGPRTGPKDEVSRKCVMAVECYVEYVKQTLHLHRHKASATSTVADLCLPMFLIAQQLREDHEQLLVDQEDYQIDAFLLSKQSIEELYSILREAMVSIQELLSKKKRIGISGSQIEWKKLTDSFKDLVGVKVANKWKRNRAEL